MSERVYVCGRCARDVTARPVQCRCRHFNRRRAETLCWAEPTRLTSSLPLTISARTPSKLSDDTLPPRRHAGRARCGAEGGGRTAAAQGSTPRRAAKQVRARAGHTQSRNECCACVQCIVPACAAAGQVWQHAFEMWRARPRNQLPSDMDIDYLLLFEHDGARLRTQSSVCHILLLPCVYACIMYDVVCVCVCAYAGMYAHAYKRICVFACAWICRIRCHCVHDGAMVVTRSL